ncbi:MAG TPA: OmpH family outer membrane protein [Nitrososphaeraceae archaeon]|nr:OmpH family outer membrane protein [Nitrososphaeraceae archaeon]
MVSDIVKDEAHNIQYEYTFELVAMPIKEELLRKNCNEYASTFIGAISWSISPNGNKFTGNYEWYKKKGDTHHTRAYSIQDVLEEYGFSFMKNNKQDTKIPCVIYGNLIPTKVHYIGQSKAEVDTAPFVKGIIKAVKSVTRSIPTFRVADILTPDYHVGSSGGTSFSLHRRIGRSWREPKPPTPERRTMFDVVYEALKERIETVKSGREWTGELHTQNQLWYVSLPLIKRWVDEGRLKKPKNRNNFLDQIRKVCDHYDVKREEVGVMAGAYAQMFFNGHWSAVNFEDIGVLADMGVVILFIEKQDVVQTLGPFTSKYGVALVNSKGHLSEYAKDLSEAAEDEGAKIAILSDYDIPGLHIASKLPNACWLGVDEDMLECFGITHEDEDNVIPYDPAVGLGDEEIKADIESDERFAYPRVDIGWLKQRIHDQYQGKKYKAAGHKVEIDAVLAKVGTEAFWNYLMSKMEEAFDTMDYTRVIHAHNHIPQTGAIENFVVPSIVHQLASHINDRYRELTKERRTELEEDLQDYEDGFVVVEDKENEIRKEINEIAYKDQEAKDIESVLKAAGTELKVVIEESINKAIKKLDAEKGYGIMDKILEGGRRGGGGS